MHSKLAAALWVLSLTLVQSLPVTPTFAASKKGGKNKRKNVVGKGFGAAPAAPDLQEVVAKFPTRVPEQAQQCECPCAWTPGKLYKDCCEPFHLKEKEPESPVEVLRSRYSAFAWRMPLYILETTHPECRDYRKDKVAWIKDLNRDGMFDSYDFCKLEASPQEFSEINPNEGFIRFKVTLRANESSGSHIEGQEIVIQEKSRFLNVGGDGKVCWKYAGGEVTSEVAGLEDAILNN
mmetsp:Transcript_13970/g.20459  ORF Transcript_13970/g.20459 Transcript_13970/m.20459 type:complete len:235 (-) Transcript_13970:767-1471(-)|eukprot:CAMPEP_0197237416 /NCGR_PEP_ID=MMETSP1429-20130617/4249_1 /TAXON_ID=49237 /ORGANISM="Chaetoceros  sp., Strain UNC1202" /LENGTH=234 /DNA_ID=CAMNT_0042696403 /DNA_START=78 /DNA_END=782 /DNA_ORIENTATION=+